MSLQPTDLGRYRIDSMLGRGGMAIVYLGYDAELHRPVAIKRLADNLAADEAFRERFAREARMAARLSHANIVQVFDLGQDDQGRPFIVMEYVEGETLADTIARQGRLPVSQVVEIGLQCCAGLGYAHSTGLIHRDIKPQNLLVTTDGEVKLADFGIARHVDQTQITQTGSVLGTVRYLAPEQAAGEPLTKAADVYSLGVVLYELLTGHTPYCARSLTELMIAQREHAPAPVSTLRPDVPPRLDAAVLACLATAPGDRPSTEFLRGALETGALRRPADTLVLTQAPTEVNPPAATRTGRHGRWMAAALASAAAVALVLVVLTLSNPGAQPTPQRPPVHAPTGPTPALHAHALARWIHEHTS